MPGFAGFDSSSFPGLATMAKLKQHTNLRWCGFYLAPAPSHASTAWMGQKTGLDAQGWGVAPLYVGQQVIPPGSQQPSQAQGQIDGADAVGLMKSAGFAVGRFVYLDIENGAPLTAAQHLYTAAWVDAVTAAGYGAGVYCSHTIAGDVHSLRPNARIWAFRVSTTKPHVVPGINFPDPHPAQGSGFTGSYAWQLAQYALINVPGCPTLTVDLDSAVAPDPGA
jgi:hypothetical protein